MIFRVEGTDREIWDISRTVHGPQTIRSFCKCKCRTGQTKISKRIDLTVKKYNRSQSEPKSIYRPRIGRARVGRGPGRAGCGSGEKGIWAHPATFNYNVQCTDNCNVIHVFKIDSKN